MKRAVADAKRGDPVIDVTLDAPQWNAALEGASLGNAGPADVATVARAAALATWRAADGPDRAEISIVLGDDALLRRLNGAYRGQDRPTNVLSFPNDSNRGDSNRGDSNGDGGAPDAPRLLGDVVLAFETVAREARAQDKTLADHLSHLCVHGVLHLLGYDHQDAAEAGAMEALEVAVLAGLGVGDPYRCASEALKRPA